MNYWIFKANPDKYRIDARLRDPDPSIFWRVTRFQDRIQKGDTVFIWRTGTPRGLCAVMKIEVHPYELQAIDMQDDGYEIQDAEFTTHSTATWAKCEIVQRFALIEKKEIQQISGLERFSFFKAFQQASNFEITPREGTLLADYIADIMPIQGKNFPAERAPIKTISEPLPEPKAVNEVDLLKCADCGRYVVSTDVDWHIREAHSGQVVKFLRT